MVITSPSPPFALLSTNYHGFPSLFPPPAEATRWRSSASPASSSLRARWVWPSTVWTASGTSWLSDPSLASRTALRPPVSTAERAFRQTSVSARLSTRETSVSTRDVLTPPSFSATPWVTSGECVWVWPIPCVFFPFLPFLFVTVCGSGLLLYFYRSLFQIFTWYLFLFY